MNKSQIQRSLVQSNSSILFNNSITHESLITNKTHLREQQFEYPPNPTISQNNHSVLLKDSQVMLKLSEKKKHELSHLHQSIKDPNINIFKLKEGEYDNMTYQGKVQSKQVFIPKDQQYQGRNNYKFQMSKREYFDTIQNIPRASLNPFHLVPDLNPKQQDLVTQPIPIYQKLSIKNQNHFLDETVFTKDFTTDGDKKSARVMSINAETNTTKTDIMPYQNQILDQSEFDLLFKQQEHQQRILYDQQQAINVYAKNHAPNFQSKSDLAQLAKCMILNQNNSPLKLKVSNTISLGKTAQDLLTVSKFNDKDYYNSVNAQDKYQNIPPNPYAKLKTSPSIANGHLVFGRISKGLIEPHNPSDKLRYYSKEDLSVRKNNYSQKNLSLKRQNLYRNLGSYNILTHQLKVQKDDYLSSIEKNQEKVEIQTYRSQQSPQTNNNNNNNSNNQQVFLTQQNSHLPPISQNRTTSNQELFI